jgi:hypothetical protein
VKHVEYVERVELVGHVEHIGHVEDVEREPQPRLLLFAGLKASRNESRCE